MVRSKTIHVRDSDIVFNIFTTIIIIFILLLMIYPLYYVLCASLSVSDKVVTAPFLYKPVGFTIASYKKIFEFKEIWLGFFNSVLYTTFGTALNVFMTMITAYPLSRKSLPGRKVIFLILVLTMYISGGLVPTYLVVDGLHLTNTFFAMNIPSAISTYFVFIALSFIVSSIPEEMLEAARIDGAMETFIFMRIVLPLAKPLVGFLAFQYGLGYWNGYTQALIYLQDRALYPLQLILREILISSQTQLFATTGFFSNIDYSAQVALQEGLKYSTMVLASIPLLVVFPFLRKYFVKGLSLGGLKG